MRKAGSVIGYVTIVTAAILLALVAVPSALADSANITINIPNSGLSATPGPYATVDLVLQGDGSIKVTVSMLSNFQMFGNGNGSGAFGFSVVGSTAGLLISNISSNSSNSANVTPMYGGTHMDGFGSFEFGINGGPASEAFSTLSFTVSRTGLFTTVAQLMEGSTGGTLASTLFAVHVAPTNGNPTGFAGTTGTAVPEPSSLLLLGAGLIAIGMARARVSNKRQP